LDDQSISDVVGRQLASILGEEDWRSAATPQIFEKLIVDEQLNLKGNE
jgi:hypothetical protein